MESNKDRRAKMYEGILPPTGTKEYERTIAFLAKQEEQNPRLKKIIKENYQKATRSFEVQLTSNCGLITELTIRHYLREFNVRAWGHGLRTMPMMFNIMEAFFNYRIPEMYFELIEEELYKVSYYDFINFISKNEFKNRQTIIKKSLTENLIFHFNFEKDLEKIRYTTESKKKMIVAGASLIRRGEEVTVVLITGHKIKKGSKPKDKGFKFDYDHPEKGKLYREFQQSIEGTELEYEYIDPKKEYAKVLVACRIDLKSNTLDARYVAEEFNHNFTVVTDEKDGLLNLKGEFSSPAYEKLWKNSLDTVAKYSVIFEAAKTALLLPFYLNEHEDNIVEESIETAFNREYKSPLKRREFKNIFGVASRFKTIFILDRNVGALPDLITIRDDLFRVETSGYWKKLTVDEYGTDKAGKPVIGKTWVNQSLSWFQAREDDLIISKEEDKFTGKEAGYIYILRNPVMEKDIFKIGLTRNDVDERAKQLSKTSVADKFYTCQEWNVKDCVKAERLIHEKLKQYRIDPRREFFLLEYDLAVAVISGVAAEINRC
jgi:hypothetical protein